MSTDPIAALAAGQALRERIIADIVAERGRQLAKWGDQRHADASPTMLARRHSTPEDLATAHLLPTARQARMVCAHAAKAGRLSWSHIATEEVAEAVESASPSAEPGDLRAEVVQLAAVCLAWLEDIDSRPKGARP